MENKNGLLETLGSLIILGVVALGNAGCESAPSQSKEIKENPSPWRQVWSPKAPSQNVSDSNIKRDYPILNIHPNIGALDEHQRAGGCGMYWEQLYPPTH